MSKSQIHTCHYGQRHQRQFRANKSLHIVSEEFKESSHYVEYRIFGAYTRPSNYVSIVRLRFSRIVKSTANPFSIEHFTQLQKIITEASQKRFVNQKVKRQSGHFLTLSIGEKSLGRTSYNVTYFRHRKTGNTQ